MKTIRCGALLLAFLVAGAAYGQTKISGSIQCGKFDPSYILPAGDSPGHVMTLGQAQCTWTKPFVVEGIALKTDVAWEFHDIHSGRGRVIGYAQDSDGNGNDTRLRFDGNLNVANGKLAKQTGTWWHTGGRAS